MPCTTPSLFPALDLRLALKFTAWTYMDPGRQGHANKRLRKFISSRLYTKWTVTVDKTKDPVAYHAGENKAFTPLEISFVTGQGRKDGDLTAAAKLSRDAEKFDVLFKQLCEILRHKKLKDTIGSEKSTMICWALHKQGDQHAEKLSRWVLPVPEKPLCFPAERIEQVLYNLVSIRLRRQDTAHDTCCGGAVLQCIECQLYQQREAYRTFDESIEELIRLERGAGWAEPAKMRAAIVKNIEALEAIDLSMTTLVTLFNNHIGRKSLTSWKLMDLIKHFIQGPYSTVAIKEKAIEELKKNARIELASFQRVSPVLAAHIRLHDGERKAEFERVCNSAQSGPEKNEMPKKLGIMSSKLRNSSDQVAQLKRVREHYDESYQKVLAETDALNKAIGREYARKGDKLFNLRGKWGRFGKKNKAPRGQCKVDEITDSDMVDEKKGWRSSTDSMQQSWHEKAEPEWLV